MLAVAAVLIGWLARARAAAADASFDPNVDGGTAGASSAPILPIALAVIVGLGLILFARTRGPGAVMTLIGTLAGFALGALFIAAGLFGDFSGRHEIFPIPIVLGVVIIAAILVALWRRRGRAQTLTR